MKVQELSGSKAGRIGTATTVLLTMTSLLVFMGGCSQTVSTAPEVQQQIQSGAADPAVASFMGATASMLTPGTENQAAMRYFNPNVQWSQYTKILLQPVEFWDSQNSSISQSDQQALTSYGYNTFKTNLQNAGFTIVDQPGPGVMTVRAALLNASAATPGLRSVSVLIPQARVLNYAQSLATDSYAFAGSAEGAMIVTDSVSGQVLAAAVDKRAGGMALSTAAQWSWGDAENAIDKWAQMTATRLTQLRGGTTATTG